ncbi:MAG: amidohydrolase family protein [Gemmatimonadaceae bacterium]
MMRSGLLSVLLVTALASRSEAQPAKSDSTKKKDLPLAPARTIDIDTDEGSWISLDVSPNGSTIVFDILGDLYTVPLAGGNTTQITTGMSFDGQPRYSPDGKWVAFTSDRDGAENVWIMNLDTKETRQITKLKDKTIESPEWTPDGKYIIATIGDIVFKPGKLWMFHVDGGSGIQLIKLPEQALTNGAAFGPDGRYIWYAQRTGSWQYNAIFPQFQIGVYDRESGRREVRTSRYGSAIRPTLSPDGKWMVYASRYEAKTGLILRDMQSGDEKWLAYPVQRDDQEAIGSRDAYPGMSFTPDSKELLTTYSGKIWRVPIDGSAPIAVPFRVQTKLELGAELAFKYPVRDSAEFDVHQIRDIAPSPDGKRLAFTALDHLYVVDLPNGTPRRLTTSDVVEAEPTWSPDGAWIGYVRWEREGGSVYKVRAIGGSAPVALLSERATYQHPAWSPDGTRIVVIRGPAEPRRIEDGPGAPGVSVDLISVPAAGGTATFISPTWGRDEPHFTKDPNRIFLWGGDSGLVSIRWDGSDQKRYLKVTAPVLLNQEKPSAPDRVLMGPNGDQAMIQSGFDVYVVTVPQVGGDPPVVSIQDAKASSVPARRLTEIGGEFATWSGDGKSVQWALGSALFTYNLDSAFALDRQVEAQKKALADDTTAAAKAKLDSLGKKQYEPAEVKLVVRATRDTPQGTVVLRGARVITMKGTEIIDGGDIVVRNNRIVSVGAQGTVPPGARVIDVTGKTIVPGFVDTHAHMWPTWGVHKQQPWMYLANLAYGVTTTRDPQTGSSDVVSYGDMVDAGQIVGPRIYSTSTGVGYWLEQLRDLDHTRKVMQRYSKYWDTKYIKMYVKGNRQVRQWVIIAAKENGIMPTTEGSLDTKYDLTMLIDGYPGQEHATPTVPLYKDVVTAYAKSGIEYTPTLIVQYGGPWAEEYYFQREQPYNDPKVRHFMPYEELASKTRRRGLGIGPGPGGWFMEEEYIFPKTAKVAADIVKAGGKIGIGSHGEFQGLGYHWELWSIASGGMPAYDVLRMATIVGAQSLGLDGDLGSLEPGKLADLVVMDRNPLEDLRNSNSVHYVMKNGRLYDGASMDEIWPRQRKMMTPYGVAETPKTAAGERP